MRRSVWIVLFFLLFTGTCLCAEIKDIRFSHSSDKTRFVIEFDQMPKEIKMGLLKNPLRLFFDIKNTNFTFKKNIFKFTKGQIKDLRLGRQSWGIRVVFDIATGLRWNTFTLKDPPRLVIDFFCDPSTRRQDPQPRVQRQPPLPPRWVVVIDPGHGGHDPGAIGPGGIEEKNITLAVAKLVKKILEKDYHIKVHLTRKDDRFIALDQRTKIANSLDADLFLSIHINAHKNKRVRGVETYLLNWTNDKEAMRVAARENKITLREMKRRQGELSVILASLKRSAKRDHSLKLAYFVHNEIIKEVAKNYRMPNNGIKQAFFYVLFGAKMPSVLVELAYISNPKEARLLSSRNTQMAYARAVARAIYRYLMSLPDAPKLAMLSDNLRKYD